MIEINPIGVVKNSIHERPETWKGTQSEVHIHKEYQEGLDGLQEFSHIVVVFYLHLSSAHTLRVHPRGKAELPVVGVFSTRAPVRPTPIGVSVVELLSISGNVLTVKGLDTFDGTPVLDIKPHLPVVSPTKLPSWVHK
jgi:tRNA-Thr(GGU) m(6)t(6)A37 methyltransferase TsaA